MPYAALAELLEAAPGAASARNRIEILGDDPVFPTPYRVSVAGAAAIASCAIAADELWALRNSTPSTQTIRIDVRHAAAALRSPRYMQIDGTAPKDLFDPLSGLYRTRERRWIFLHCNFAHHRQAVLRVLGLADDAGRNEITSAVSQQDAGALEEAVHTEGGCAGMVRTAEQWAQHPQSAAVALLPLIEMERIGD